MKLIDPALGVKKGRRIAGLIGVRSDLDCQWQWSGFNLDGATNRSLTLADVQAAQAGLYSVIISNAVGLVASAVARLDVIIPPAVLEIASPAADTNHLVHLNLNAAPGVGCWLEASTDMRQWQSLTNFTQAARIIEFVDPDSTNFWKRFYRLRWSP